MRRSVNVFYVWRGTSYPVMRNALHLGGNILFTNGRLTSRGGEFSPNLAWYFLPPESHLYNFCFNCFPKTRTSDLGRFSYCDIKWTADFRDLVVRVVVSVWMEGLVIDHHYHRLYTPSAWVDCLWSKPLSDHRPDIRWVCHALLAFP